MCTVVWGCNWGVLCGKCMQARVCECVSVCARMRLFVTANSLIPQHVPETCNRCLRGECAHSRRRKTHCTTIITINPRSLRLLLLPVMLEHESQVLENKRRIICPCRSASLQSETLACFTTFLTNPVILIRLNGIAKQADSQNQRGDFTKRAADVCRPPDLRLRLWLLLLM